MSVLLLDGVLVYVTAKLQESPGANELHVFESTEPEAGLGSLIDTAETEAVSKVLLLVNVYVTVFDPPLLLQLAVTCDVTERF